MKVIVERRKLQENRGPRLAILLLAAAAIGGLVALSPLAALIVGLALLGVTIIGWVTVFRPIWILYGLVFFIPLTSGVERGKFLPMFRPNEPLLLIAVVLFILSRKKIRRMKLTRIHLVIALYLISGSVLPLFTSFLRGGVVDFSSLMPLLAPWQYLVLFWLIIVFDVTVSQTRRCLQVLVLAGAIISMVAILQMMRVKPVISMLTAYYYSPHLMRVEEWGYPRTTSLLANWHGTGVYLSFSVLILLAYHVTGSKLFSSRSAGLLAALLVAGIVTTTSITSLVVLGLGGIIILLASKRIKARWLVWLVPLVVLVASLAFSTQVSTQLEKQFAGRDSIVPKGIVYRVDNWREEFLPIVAKNWLFGYGTELPTDISVPSEDSQWVYMLLRGGVFYVVGFLVLIASVIQFLWHSYRETCTPQTQALFLTAATLFVTIVPACFLQAYMTYSGVAEYLWILLGLSVSARKGRFLRLECLRHQGAS